MKRLRQLKLNIVIILKLLKGVTYCDLPRPEMGQEGSINNAAARTCVMSELQSTESGPEMIDVHQEGCMCHFAPYRPY